MKLLSAFIALSFALTIAFSQQTFPQDYFSPPLKIPVATSGTFGELRANHFHSGFDLRINGVIGEPVYAVADGYVSRIRISSSGGGKMLYIDHPNGFRSVFFHLDSYEGEVGKYVYDYQYRNKKFEFEVFTEKGKFPVKKGQQIARAGNTGSSGGPHLHYELRYSANDETLNPLLFGLKMEDNISPTIRGINVYLANSESPGTCISTLKETVKQAVKGKDGKTKTVTKTVDIDTLKAWGMLYFGIDYTDKSAGSTNIGVPKVKLTIDDTVYFSYHIKSFRFDQTRYVNAMIDYPMYIKNGKRYLVSRILPGNKIHLIEESKNNGYFDCTDGKLHKVVYEVTDFKGNTAKRTFYLQSDEKAKRVISGSPQDTFYTNTRFAHTSTNRISIEDRFSLTAVAGTFFEDILFRYREEQDTIKRYYSNLYHLGQEQPIPAFHSYTLQIKPTVPIPERLKNKAIIVRIENGKLYSEGGKWEGGYLTMSTRNFATFAISLDTIPPEISPVNFSNNKQSPATLKVRIKDSLSGIKSYNCYLNNEWILAEYDAKTNTLILDSGKKLRKGNNKLKVIVVDNCGNQKTEEYTVLF